MMQPPIHDKGIGFDPGAVVIAKDPRPRLGLTGMKSRAELPGGVFALTSRRGNGTGVPAAWALPQTE